MKGTLTTQQMKELFKEGFVGREVKAYNSAPTGTGEVQSFQFNSKTFVAARKSRMAWFDSMRDDGWSEREIRGKINEFYALKATKSPFSFLKLSYKPKAKLPDYMEAHKRKIRARATKILGYSYGRKLRKRPYKRPIRPQLPIRRRGA